MTTSTFGNSWREPGTVDTQYVPLPLGSKCTWLKGLSRNMIMTMCKQPSNGIIAGCTQSNKFARVFLYPILRDIYEAIPKQVLRSFVDDISQAQHGPAGSTIDGRSWLIQSRIIAVVQLFQLNRTEMRMQSLTNQS